MSTVQSTQLQKMGTQPIIEHFSPHKKLGPIYTKCQSLGMLRQLCDNTSDTVLIENNGVPPKWGCNSNLEQLTLLPPANEVVER